MQNSFYDFTVKDSTGNNVPLSNYKGKLVMVVNVASKCGFTPQYEGLQKLYSEYKDRDFVILGFPCNQFLQQEPGDNAEIQSFCKLNYGVEFPVLAKIDVNGTNADPLYKFLKSERPEIDDAQSFLKKVEKSFLELIADKEEDSDISWNFEKFLIDRDGKVIARYSSAMTPEELEPVVSSHL